MNILVVSQYFWPEAFRINDVVSGLQARGHQVEVLTGLPNYPSGSLFSGYEGISWWRRRHETFGSSPVHRVPLVPRGAGGGLRLMVNYASFALSATLFGAQAREIPDVILAFEPSPITVGIPAAALRQRYQVPLAFWVQDLWPESLTATGAVRRPEVLSAVSALVRWIYARCDLLLVQSRAFTRSLVEHGVPLGRIEYLPNSAEAFYQPMELAADAAERGIVPEGFVIMFAGNLGVSQDLESLLNAAELVRDQAQGHKVRWVILGDGRQRSWLEQQVLKRNLTDQVHLLGQYPAEQMPSFFSLADVLLVSLRDESAFEHTVPSKIQSYLAVGRPVIAALNGEGARVIQDAGAGLAPGAQQPQALAQAVLQLAGCSKEQLKQMGERGRQYFLQHFERERVLDQLEAQLVQLSKASKRRKT